MRDPIARSQSSFVQRSGGRRAKRLAFSHPVVLTLVARQAFAIGSVAEWSRCNGRPIGAIVPIVLSRPTDFEGEVPVQGTDDTNRYAYLEGVAQMRVQNGVSFDVYVDLNRHKVVGIMARVRVPGSGVDPMPEVDVRPIGELRPAGGHAAGNCVQQGD